MANEGTGATLEAVLIRGLNYAFMLKGTDRTSDFISCKAAAIVPVQQCTCYIGKPIDSKLALRFYAGPEDISLQKFIRPDESFNLEKLSDGIFDVRFGEDTYRLCNFGGKWVGVQKKDFSDLANEQYPVRRKTIEEYVSNWLKEAFKDGS